MGNSNKVCPSCGRKMKQQFIGLQHCKWYELERYWLFERTSVCFHLSATVGKSEATTGNTI